MWVGDRVSVPVYSAFYSTYDTFHTYTLSRRCYADFSSTPKPSLETRLVLFIFAVSILTTVVHDLGIKAILRTVMRDVRIKAILMTTNSSYVVSLFTPPKPHFSTRSR